MSSYIRKDASIQAFQWTTGMQPSSFPSWFSESKKWGTMADGSIVIYGSSGNSIVSSGNYIAMDSKGSLMVFDENIFKSTYDIVQ